MKAPLFKYLNNITPCKHNVLLVCFHHGGGGASLYRAWPENLRKEADVVAIQLPGREDRLGEDFYTDAHQIASEVSQYLNATHYQSIVLFGYCMGGLIAYELAQQIQKGKLKALMIAASAEPAYAVQHGLNTELTDEALGVAFTKIFEERYQMPCEPEYLEMMMPILKADRRINIDYQLPNYAPLNVPIVLMGGESDAGIPKAALEAWRQRTSADFELKMFPGGHMFIEVSEEQLFNAVKQTLGEK